MFKLKKIINFVPLFLLISTGVQLFLVDYSIYFDLYYSYLSTFHNYGIISNLILLYYSHKYADSIVSDLSIIGLIVIDIVTSILYLINKGVNFDINEYNQAIMVWGFYISFFFICAIITLLYLKVNKYKLF